MTGVSLGGYSLHPQHPRVSLKHGLHLQNPCSDLLGPLAGNMTLNSEAFWKLGSDAHGPMTLLFYTWQTHSMDVP